VYSRGYHRPILDTLRVLRGNEWVGGGGGLGTVSPFSNVVVFVCDLLPGCARCFHESAPNAGAVVLRLFLWEFPPIHVRGR
jgi:hypothetical protein